MGCTRAIIPSIPRPQHPNTKHIYILFNPRNKQAHSHNNCAHVFPYYSLGLDAFVVRTTALCSSVWHRGVHCSDCKYICVCVCVYNHIRASYGTSHSASDHKRSFVIQPVVRDHKSRASSLQKRNTHLLEAPEKYGNSAARPNNNSPHHSRRPAAAICMHHMRPYVQPHCVGAMRAHCDSIAVSDAGRFSRT